MEVTNTEMFLILWAGIATVLAVIYRDSAKKFRIHQMCTAGLLAEVVTGETKPVFKDGFWVIENDDMRMAFRKKGE